MLSLSFLTGSDAERSVKGGKDGLPNSLTHVKLNVVHSLITNLFDF